MTTRQMTEIAILIALATGLEYLSMVMPRLPQGGSISISILPIIVLAYRHGLKIGVISGLIFGLINWMLVGFVIYVHWIEGPVDYILAYGVVGLAALVFKYKKHTATTFAIAAAIGGLLRFIVHFLSGITIFSVFTPEGQSTWLYSLTYNASYMVPTIILVAILGFIIYTIMEEQLKPSE